MPTFREYLREKAKFFSPQVDTRSNPDTTDLSPLEVARLDDQWKPNGCRRDKELVDSLLRTLDVHLGDRPVDSSSSYDRYFQPFIDDDGMSIAWIKNKEEPQSLNMVFNGALVALSKITRALGYRLNLEQNCTPLDGGFASQIDFALYITDGEGKRVLVEVKAPDVLNSMLKFLELAEGTPVHLRLWPRQVTGEKVINRMCLYMASHKARWGAITSHEKWLFIRLHPGEDPFITFSAVEKQEDNTRPFRALLAMLLAAELNLEVESHADLESLLATIPEEDENDPTKELPDVDPREDKSDTFKGSGKVTREDPPVTRPGNRTEIREAFEVPDLEIGWSQQIVARPRTFSFYKVDLAGNCMPLRPGTAKLSLHRILGFSSTGMVYQATLDGNESVKDTNARSYAVKIVHRGSTQEKRGGLERLRNEFEAYCKIGESGADLAPRCYGLYDSTYMLALILDYEGEALTNLPWSSVPFRDRLRIFELLSALHKIGIIHKDIEPRNIVRSSDGSLKLIDFSQAGFHDCPGIREASRILEKGRNLLTGQFAHGAISNYIGTPDSQLFSSTPVHDAQSAVDGLGCYPTSYTALRMSRPLHTPDVDCALHRILSVDRIAREIVEILPEMDWSWSAMSGVNRGRSLVNMSFALWSFCHPDTSTAPKISTFPWTALFIQLFAASTFRTPRYSDDILTRECGNEYTQLLAG
ncbi:kinase-like protein [Sanghuangporus baumii]|uniref:Kinase-like protein n=1 Tax=Sanghuangporus baumii TaxID=108892 RepID=A0A9Q5I1P5_SANBA|nr:kinase-like protein [Sanghuangporus baumii]